MGSITALDLSHIPETRRLAQVLATLEAELVEVKWNALAAGCDLKDDDDLSSGFGDDDEDGDYASSEEDIPSSSRNAVTEKWLDGLPSADSAHSLEDSNLAISPDTKSTEAVEVDDWDAQSLEMHDSISMVAEGSTRKRIDKWKRQLESAMHANEFTV